MLLRIFESKKIRILIFSFNLSNNFTGSNKLKQFVQRTISFG